MVPDNLSTTLEGVSELQYTFNNMFSNGMRTQPWSGHQGRYVPSASREAKRFTGRCTWSVVVGKLDVLIERQPLTFPTPDGTAMYAATIRNHLRGQLFLYE
jgi:hypothetical protein